jgi:hypothetical protein
VIQTNIIVSVRHVLSYCLEIDELYAKKKELVAQNKKQLDVYFEGIRSQKKARYEEETRRKEEERRIAHEAYQKEMYVHNCIIEVSR